MLKHDAYLVGHMIDSARRITAFMAGRGRADYDADEMLRLAVVHLVQTMGEAARKLSPAVCLQHPEVPWAKIVAMRHRLVHDYLNVDYDIVWEVVMRDIPPLIPELERIASRPPQPSAQPERAQFDEQSSHNQ